MSVPSIVKGQYFDVAVDPEGDGNFVYLCGLNTRNLTHQVNTNDEAVPDCEKPGTVAWRVLNATSQQKDMAGTGLHNLEQSGLIRSIFGKTLTYRFIEAQPGATADDKATIGYWEGPFMMTNWQEGASDGTNVTSQFTFSSDGEIPWIPAATLAALGVSPSTATSGSPFTGTISGRTPGSTITATSTGASGISVIGNTVTATWATTGSKTLTLVETLTDADGSPRTSTATITVS